MQNQDNAPGRERTLESLVELVAALDRRVPHIDRSSEEQIAGQASQLRAEASLRIDRLQRSATSAQPGELTPPAAVTIDDGEPSTAE